MKNFWYGGVLAIFLVALDEVIKILILKKLSNTGAFFDSWLFQIALHKKYGIAFDIPFNQFFLILITLATIVILSGVFFHYIRRGDYFFAITLCFIIAGAAGNLIDRIVYGFVVDYIIILGRSAINLSDILIVGGTLALIGKQWLRKSH